MSSLLPASSKVILLLVVQIIFHLHQAQLSYSFTIRSTSRPTATATSIAIEIPTITANRISTIPGIRTPLYSTNNNNNNYNSDGIKEAERLLAKAKEIRNDLAKEKAASTTTTTATTATTTTSKENTNINTPRKNKTPFNVQYDQKIEDQCDSIGYRLYLDIGREDGTWMDPRWGASGKRIECSIDVSFLTISDSASTSSSATNDSIPIAIAGEDIINEMVKDNLTGKSSIVQVINSGPVARLRNGFDQMKVRKGGYRIDVNGERLSASNTVRFYLDVDGTEGEGTSTYGDISIPKGNLYFSLPCFGKNAKQLSSKEGIVTVRQFGWHTGWRREESRIVGVFRAVPIDKAIKRDGF